MEISIMEATKAGGKMVLGGKVVGQLVEKVTLVRKGGTEKRSTAAKLVQRLIIEEKPLEDTNSADDESVVAMLPEGYWPFGEGDGGGKPRPPEDPLPERFEFLRTFNPREISGFSLGRRFNYRGFMVGRFIITDNLGYGNAIYLYDGTYGDEWLSEVEKTKHNNLINPGRSFVCRITHHPGWQEKLLAVLRAG